MSAPRRQARNQTSPKRGFDSTHAGRTVHGSLLMQLEGPGDAYAPPVGSWAKPQPQTNFYGFWAPKSHLVATFLIIFMPRFLVLADAGEGGGSIKPIKPSFARGLPDIRIILVLMKTELTEQKYSDDNWDDDGGNVDIRVTGGLGACDGSRHVAVDRRPAVVAVTDE